MNRRHFFLAAGAVALSPALPAAAGPATITSTMATDALSANAVRLLKWMRHLNATSVSQPADAVRYHEIKELHAHGLLSDPALEEGSVGYDSISGGLRLEDRVSFDLTEAGHAKAEAVFGDAFYPYEPLRLSTVVGPPSDAFSITARRA